MRDDLINEMEEVGGYKFLGRRLDNLDSKSAKDLIYQVIDIVPNAVVVIGMKADDKAQLHMGISKGIAAKGTLDAGKMIREISRNIQGGGGKELLLGKIKTAFSNTLIFSNDTPVPMPIGCSRRKFYR